MKKWFCVLAVFLTTCYPALADLPREPWPTNSPKKCPLSLIGGTLPIMIIAVVLVAASIILWLAIRAHKEK